MAVAVRRAALAVGVPGQIGLELVEESPTAFVDSCRGQSVSYRALTAERLEMPVLRELPERPPDRPLVVDEPKNVGDGDVGTKALAVQPEHDL